MRIWTMEWWNKKKKKQREKQAVPGCVNNLLEMRSWGRNQERIPTRTDAPQDHFLRVFCFQSTIYPGDKLRFEQSSRCPSKNIHNHLQGFLWGRNLKSMILSMVSEFCGGTDPEKKLNRMKKWDKWGKARLGLISFSFRTNQRQSSWSGDYRDTPLKSDNGY